MRRGARAEHDSSSQRNRHSLRARARDAGTSRAIARVRNAYPSAMLVTAFTSESLPLVSVRNAIAA